MTLFAQNHPKITALLLSIVLGVAWVAALTADFAKSSPSGPAVVRLPDVVIIGKRTDLDAEHTPNVNQTAALSTVKCTKL